MSAPDPRLPPECEIMKCMPSFGKPRTFNACPSLYRNALAAPATPHRSRGFGRCTWGCQPGEIESET